jgi:predicted ATP-grasp superfamily ATP-dependent carboligase
MAIRRQKLRKYAQSALVFADHVRIAAAVLKLRDRPSEGSVINVHAGVIDFRPIASLLQLS